jgi:phosphopantetheinyl transferase
MLRVFALAMGAGMKAGGRERPAADECPAANGRPAADKHPIANGHPAADEYLAANGHSVANGCPAADGYHAADEYPAADKRPVANGRPAADEYLAANGHSVANGYHAADEYLAANERPAADEYLAADEYEALRALVSREKAERLGKFRRFADAGRSLLGDVLARRAICLCTGMQNSELRFELSERGKPVLRPPAMEARRNGPCAGDPPGRNLPAMDAPAARAPDVGAPAMAALAMGGRGQGSGAGPRRGALRLPHFNISHSGGHVVCAVCDEPVGIDVEVVKPIDMNIANRFFSEDERERIFSGPEDERGRLGLFYDVWTRKESFIKMTGEGLSRPLKAFSVFGEPEWNGGAARFCRISVGDGAVCHVCSACGGDVHVLAERVAVADLLAWARTQQPGA